MAGGNGGGRQIVVLDDAPSTLEMLERFLKKMEFVPHCTSDGEEALQLIAKGGIDLALVDLLMPKMSGMEFLSHLQELPEATRPAVIVITGRQDDAAYVEYAPFDVYAAIQKPFELNELMDNIEGALQN